jgi:hypothetical protein
MSTSLYYLSSMCIQVLLACVPAMHSVGSSKCATVCACSGEVVVVLLPAAFAATCEMLLVAAAGSIHLKLTHILPHLLLVTHV